MNLKKKIARLIPTGMRPAASRLYEIMLDARDSVCALCLAPARHRRRQDALPAPGAPRRTITLFLAPEAALEPFFASHVLLARVLKDAGYEALLLTCDGLMPTCSAKLARQVTHTAPNDGGRTCRHCKAVVNRVGHDYGLADVTIESLLPASARADMDAVVAAHFEAPWDVVEDGIEIGRACLGEALRTQRKLSLDELDDTDKAFIRALVYSSLAVYRSVKLLAEMYDIRHIAYFGDYAFFIAPQIFAKWHGITVTNVSHAYNRDIDRRFLNLRPGHGFSHMMSQIDKWPVTGKLPIPPEEMVQILDGGLYRMRGFGGASTYSPNWNRDSADVLQQLGLPPGGKLLVAFSNSTDELLCNREILRVMNIPYAHTRNPFSSQIEWLKTLVQWVAAKPDLRLVIRLHPRMAKGHRHPQESSEAGQMRREFSTLPSNVVVVWPDSKISSYNIAEHADAVLTAWSSIGLELARLGLPLVSAFQRIGPWPTGKFNLFSETQDGYFKAVEQALNRPPGMGSILDAVRWTYSLNWTPLIDISDVTPDPDYGHVPRYRPPANGNLILKAVAENVDLVDLALGKLSATPAAIATERAALEAAMGQAFKYLLTGEYQLAPREYVILLPGQEPATIGSGAGPRIHVAANGDVTYEDGGQTDRRHSPLLARLARSVASRTYD
jgi:hypothetical protein